MPYRHLCAGCDALRALDAAPGFDARDRQELLRRILDEEPASPRRSNPAIPRDLETIILKAMEKEPSARYASARELADDLRRFLDDQPIQVRNRGARINRSGDTYLRPLRMRAAIVATLSTFGSSRSMTPRMMSLSGNSFSTARSTFDCAASIETCPILQLANCGRKE